MGRILIILIIILAIDLFIGMCIAFMLHHSQSDEPFKINKDVFRFALTGWWKYIFKLTFK